MEGGIADFSVREKQMRESEMKERNAAAAAAATLCVMRGIIFRPFFIFMGLK